MSWKPLAQLELSDAWQFTQTIEADYIRIRFANPINPNGRGYICQADESLNDRQIFQVERMYPKAEAEVIYVPRPYCFASRAIGFKAKVFAPIAPWSLTVDYWDTPMPLSNPVNVSIAPVTSSNVTASTVNSATTNTSLLASNANRKGATIWNNSTATLNLELGATASTNDYTAQLAPGGYYEVPYGYTGAISGVWSAANGNALVRELT